MPEETVSRDSTEEDYNAQSRCVVMKLDIYFDGLDKAPLEVSRDNYLIDASVLEEACADSDNPFGAVSSNEISFSLYNSSGMFSPTQSTGPYYGKINTGVPIIARIKPDVDSTEVNYDTLGLFYVTDWNATITGVTANVVANDVMYFIFSKPQTRLPVFKGISMQTLYEKFFEAIMVDVSIDSDLSETLLYAYIMKSNKDFLNDMSIGSQSYIFCNRSGVPRVEYARGPQEVKHTLTDTDQIVNIISSQSILVEYSGAKVVMNKPQESPVEALLSINNELIPSGSYNSKITSFKLSPVYKVSAALLNGGANASISNIVATCTDVAYTLHNDSPADINSNLEILGTYIDTVSTEYSSGSEEGNVLSVDNIYVQTAEYAEKFLKFLTAYVKSNVPVLELEIRGNPKYLPGEKIHVVSDKYSVDFTGVLIRQEYTYDGSLSSKIKLFNSEIMEVL